MQYSDIKTTSDYEAYVKDAAESIVENAIERLKEDEKPVNAENIGDCISDEGLVYEDISNDAIIIYYFGHELIMQHTDNVRAAVDGLDGCDDWHQVRAAFAFWAFEADVQEVLSEAIKEGAYPEDINASQKELIAAEWERLDPLKRSYEEGAE